MEMDLFRTVSLNRMGYGGIFVKRITFKDCTAVDQKPNGRTFLMAPRFQLDMLLEHFC